MVRFAALLRRHGLPVTPEHVTDGVRALEQLDLADREEVRIGLRAVFAGRRAAPFAPELQDGRRQLFANVVERHPRLLAPPRYEHAAQRWGQLRDAERHRDLEGSRHHAMRARRPVRRS